MRGWRRVDRQAEAREAARQHAGRALHVYQDDDGTVVLRGRLTPEVGALLRRALDAARETLYQRRRGTEAGPPATDPAQEPPTRPQQQADALALLAETALHHELDPGAPGERYQVVVHVDAAVLADPEQPGQSVLEEGSRVPAGTSQRLACDASRVVMRYDEDGRVVEVGARTRTIPRHYGGRCSIGTGAAASRAATSRRAGASRAPLGAGRPDDAVESGATVSSPSPGGARGGLSDRTNARRGHCSSAGRTAGCCPRCGRGGGACGSGGGAARATRCQGLRVHARTTCPGWLGERLDVGWAIGVLHPLATRAFR